MISHRVRPARAAATRGASRAGLGAGEGRGDISKKVVPAARPTNPRPHFTGYPLKLHFQIPCVFPVYSLPAIYFCANLHNL